MYDIGALDQNRVPVNWEVVIFLNIFLMPFKAVRRSLDIKARMFSVYYSGACKLFPPLERAVDGMFNEIVFQGVRLLGIGTVFKWLHKPLVFRDKAVEAYINQGPPKRPGLGKKTKDQCDKYRKQHEAELTIRIPGKPPVAL